MQQLIFSSDRLWYACLPRLLTHSKWVLERGIHDAWGQEVDCCVERLEDAEHGTARAREHLHHVVREHLDADQASLQVAQQQLDQEQRDASPPLAQGSHFLRTVREGDAVLGSEAIQHLLQLGAARRLQRLVHDDGFGEEVLVELAPAEGDLALGTR